MEMRDVIFRIDGLMDPPILKQYGTQWRTQHI